MAVNLQYQRMKNAIPEVISKLTKPSSVSVHVYGFVPVPGSEDKLPEFTDEVDNRTVVAGREAILSCHVQHLGSYKVSHHV